MMSLLLVLVGGLAVAAPPARGDREARGDDDRVERVLASQTTAGGWPKSPGGPATIDNGATTSQLRQLADSPHLNAATAPGAPDPRVTAFLRGLDWLLAAQYPTGGWPQVFPLAGDYHDRITFNDDAMVNALSLLREISSSPVVFPFVDGTRRASCRNAVRRGVECILRAQVVESGTPTVWCQQHDERTLAPAPGRSFEPAALVSTESVRIVRFLMGEERTPAVIRAVEAASAWFEKSRLPDGRWARFYEFRTGRPVFSGRDGVITYSIDEIAPERRTGYAWFTDRPAKFLSRDLVRWRRQP